VVFEPDELAARAQVDVDAVEAHLVKAPVPGPGERRRGRTERALHGQRMVLRYDYLPLRGRSRHRTLAPVRIDRRGRFRYRNWRPRRRGSYRLYALYRPRSASRVRDVSCSRGFALRG
jgi:hypothetical protein